MCDAKLRRDDVHIYGIESGAGHDCIAMEHVDGRTLDDVVRAKGLSIREVLDCAGADRPAYLRPTRVLGGFPRRTLGAVPQMRDFSRISSVTR